MYLVRNDQPGPRCDENQEKGVEDLKIRILFVRYLLTTHFEPRFKDDTEELFVVSRIAWNAEQTRLQAKQN